MEKKEYVTKKEVLEAIPGGLLGISISSVMCVYLNLALISSRNYPYECLVYKYILYISLGLGALMIVFIPVRGLLSKRRVKYLCITLIAIFAGLYIGMALMSCVVSAGEYNLVNFFWGI